MASRRTDAGPGLLDRVRWGNVGRLLALFAGAIMIATGPHGCEAPRGADSKLQIADPLPAVVKAAPVSPSLPAVRERRRLRKPRKHVRHRPRRKHSHARTKPLQSAIPQS